MIRPESRLLPAAKAIYTRAMRQPSIIGSFAARFALAAFGGALYAASLPPLGLWWMAWVALTPLCIACVGVRPLAGAMLGLGFGLVAAADTTPWFPTMIGDYFAQSDWLRWPLALLGWTLCGAAYHSIAGAWIAWSLRSGPVSPAAVGAAWWLCDWARANALVANPWALLGYSQVGFLPLAQLADLVGPYGIGALLAASSAAAAGLLLPKHFGGSVGRNGLTLVVLFASSLVYGTLRLSQEPPQSQELRGALVQGALPRRLRSDPGDAAVNLARHLALTEEIVRQARVDLVVWPELALDFYIEREPVLRRRLVESVGSLGIELIAGGLGMDLEARRPTNSVFLVNGQGLRARYDKVHLMAFSEANPLPFDLGGEDAMSAGKGVRLLRTRRVAFGLVVCSEAMHPGYVREVVRAGANVLLAPSVDSWFASAGGRRQQLDAVAMRAIETRRFLLRPTASGITAVIDPFGRVLVEAPIDEPTAVPASFSARHELTPYVRFGDVGIPAALLLIAFDAARRRHRRSTAESRSPDGAPQAAVPAAPDRRA